MRRFLCIVLVFILVIISTAAFAADDDWVDFEPILVNGMDNSSSTWMSSSYNRALLTWLLVLDLYVSGYQIDDIVLTDVSYVGRAKEAIDLTIAAGLKNGKCLIIVYNPVLKNASWTEGISNNASYIEHLLNKVTDNCYKNSLGDLMEVAETISGIIGS